MSVRRWLSLACAGQADLTALAMWCQAFTPLTAPDPPDGVLLDITGCAHLFGGEEGLKTRLLTRLPCTQMAIADTPAAAWALARYEGALPDLSLAALRLPPETVGKLRRIGVRTIGQLAQLPRASLVAGYGAAVTLRLAQCFGEAPEPIHFITAPPEWRELEHHVEPLLAPEQLQAALSRLAAALCVRLEEACIGATVLSARFYRVDGSLPSTTLGFAVPCRDEAQITRLLKEKLSGIDPGFGIETLALEASTTEPLALIQRSTLDDAPDYGAPLNTLLNRLGAGRLWRMAAQESHIPEYAAIPVPVTARTVWPLPAHPRPLRLLASPEPIIVLAPVPDNPPVRFIWAGQTHRVAHATGPERIARDWWAHPYDTTRPEAEKIRDYYAVEDTSGARFWLFRAGLHEGMAAPRWYLHGLFA